MSIRPRGHPQVYLVWDSGFFKPLPHSSLADLQKILQQFLNAKSSLEEIQDAHFHLLLMKRIVQQ